MALHSAAAANWHWPVISANLKAQWPQLTDEDLEYTEGSEEALIAHTRSNAYILFMERDLGTLETGKLADLVVLDRDYMTIPADDMRNLKPLMTMVGGKVVHEVKP